MKLEIRRPKALPVAKLHVRTHVPGADELRWKHGLSTEVAERIVARSLTMVQAHATAELMK